MYTNQYITQYVARQCIPRAFTFNEVVTLYNIHGNFSVYGRTFFKRLALRKHQPPDKYISNVT